MFPLIFKKNLKIYPDALRRHPDDFSRHHAAFTCRGKGDRHGNFLPDREFPAGFNKNAVGTNITDGCDKCTISGFAGGCRQDFIKPLSAATSSIQVIEMPISAIRFGHNEKTPVIQTNFNRMPSSRLWHFLNPDGVFMALRAIFLRCSVHTRYK
jgi:hypothetical protein